MARPRKLPEGEALERALKVFWERGFDRTSIADLSEAIGVGPSSLYNAFGNKEAIYRRALDRYMESHGAFVLRVLGGEQSAEDALRDLLRSAVKLYTSPGLPSGCAMLQSGGASSPDGSAAGAITFELKQGLEKGVRKFLDARLKSGESLAAPPRVLAKFVVATLRGLSQLAVDGVSQRDLLRVADHAAQSCVPGSGEA
ncbi:MAG: TetR/AcrR family transcriptional regulator [Planctomycetes bacterium]|nr:TetR/AcrR family transcriptional regulator [Planctomycetota bacterium]